MSSLVYSLKCLWSVCWSSLSRVLSTETVLRWAAALTTLFTRRTDWTNGRDTSSDSSSPPAMRPASLLPPDVRLTSWEKMAAVRWGNLVITTQSERQGCRAESLARSRAPASKKLRICLSLNFSSSSWPVSQSNKFWSSWFFTEVLASILFVNIPFGLFVRWFVFFELGTAVIWNTSKIYIFLPFLTVK